jgi:hypothetical protein
MTDERERLAVIERAAGALWRELQEAQAATGVLVLRVRYRALAGQVIAIQRALQSARAALLRAAHDPATRDHTFPEER